MLQQRIITAIVLLAVTALCLGSGVTWLEYAFLAAWVIIGCWEWSRLARPTTSPSQNRFLAISTLLVSALLLAYVTYSIADQSKAASYISHDITILACGLAAAWWLYIFTTLNTGVQKLHYHQAPFYAIGFLLLLFTGYVLLNGYQQYAYTLFSAMTLVWIADTGAYFSGKAFGKNKLAPTISPGKTWEGVWGALVAVYALAAIWIAIDYWLTHDWLLQTNTAPSIFGVLWQASPMALIVGVPILLASSICGDLIESIAKRLANAKDSSQLLPGHGGVLDRIDALLPTLPTALAFASLIH